VALLTDLIAIKLLAH